MKKPFKILIVFAVGAAVIALSFFANGAAATVTRIAGVLLVIAAAASLLAPQKNEPLNPEYAYKVRPSLMTAPEKSAFALLREALPEYEIYPQIALVSIIDKTSAAYRNELFRVLDFCVFTRGDVSPVLAVELNDSSHERADRRERDEKVKCILERAGLPLLTLKLADLDLDARAVRKAAKSAMKRKP